MVTGDSIYRGKTLAELTEEYGMDVLLMAVVIILSGDPAIASFMMDQTDVDQLMLQPWVVTSSDGSEGHPRKFGSFPKKYSDYVAKKGLLTIEQFVRQSSARTAQIFGLCDRGLLANGYVADIAVWDNNEYRSAASYERPTEVAQGVRYLIVNGKLTIANEALTGALSGEIINRTECSK